MYADPRKTIKAMSEVFGFILLSFFLVGCDNGIHTYELRVKTPASGGDLLKIGDFKDWRFRTDEFRPLTTSILWKNSGGQELVLRTDFSDLFSKSLSLNEDTASVFHVGDSAIFYIGPTGSETAVNFSISTIAEYDYYAPSVTIYAAECGRSERVVDLNPRPLIVLTNRDGDSLEIFLVHLDAMGECPG